MLKIIAGKHKNRSLPFLKKAKYRPSTSKIREAIFSILTSGEFINGNSIHYVDEDSTSIIEIPENPAIFNPVEDYSTNSAETSDEKPVSKILPVQNSVLWESEVLDLYAGTGSLAFEALSRGAKSITLVDIEAEYLQAAKEFADLIGESDNTRFLCRDALNLPKAYVSYDIIFMDPPYHKKLAEKTIKNLIRGGWLKNGSLILVELAKTEDVAAIEGIELIKRRVYGNSKLLIFRYQT